MSYHTTTLVKSYARNGLTVQIHTDTDAESPDAWGNDDCFLVAFHRGFTVKRDGWGRDVDPNDPETYDADRYEVIPLKAYIHSGVSLSVGYRSGGDCQWDTSNVGYIVIDRSAWGEAADPAPDWIGIAKSLVDEWNTYLSGDVYGYVVVDSDGEEVNDGSCWGFYGMEYAEEEANACADSYIAPAHRLLL